MNGLQFQQLPAAQMLDEQYSMEQRQITQWFDSMRFSLEQQELEPEQHQKAYMQVMRQAQQKGLAIHNRHQANAQFLQQLDELVEDGTLADYQAKKIAYRMAGIQDPEMLRQLSGEPQEVDWMRTYRENVGVQRNITGFLKNYTVEKGQLYEIDSKGEIVDKKNPETADVVQHYNMALNLLDYYKQQERDIYTQLYPMEQAALEMERVAVSKMDERAGLQEIIRKIMRPFGFQRTAAELMGEQLKERPVREQFLGRYAAGGLPGILGSKEGRKLGKEFLMGPEEQPVEQTMRMRKPGTDEMIVSYDGGETWFKER